MLLFPQGNPVHSMGDRTPPHLVSLPIYYKCSRNTCDSPKFAELVGTLLCNYDETRSALTQIIHTIALSGVDENQKQPRHQVISTNICPIELTNMLKESERFYNYFSVHGKCTDSRTDQENVVQGEVSPWASALPTVFKTAQE